MQVKGIVGTLVEVLATPSAEVQRAVAACLPPLMPTVKTDPDFTPKLVADLMQQLLHGKTYGARCRRHMPDVKQHCMVLACLSAAAHAHREDRFRLHAQTGGRSHASAAAWQDLWCQVR